MSLISVDSLILMFRLDPGLIFFRKPDPAKTPGSETLVEGGGGARPEERSGRVSGGPTESDQHPCNSTGSLISYV